MALFNRWKNTVEKLTHPVVQEEQNTEVATEDEASIFAKAFLECLTNLENRLHSSTKERIKKLQVVPLIVESIYNINLTKPAQEDKLKCAEEIHLCSCSNNSTDIIALL